MINKKHIISLMFLLLLPLKVYSQENVLLYLGNEELTEDEFRNRFELMPHFTERDKSIDTLKKEFLYSLAAEKLWAMEASEQGIDTFESVNYSLNTLKDLFIKDELYKSEVESKIRISQEEISIGISRIGFIYKINILTSGDSGEIFRLYNNLESGDSFDSLLADRDEYKVQQKPIIITYGRLSNEVVEDTVFSLASGRYSFPFQIDEEWFIIKVTNIESNPAVNSNSDHARNIVFNRLREKKGKEIGGRYLDSLLGGRQVTVDQVLYKSFYHNLQEFLEDKNGESDSIITLKENDISTIIKSYSKDTLHMEFINLSNNSIKLNDLLYYLVYQKLTFNKYNEKEITAVLNQTVKNFIQDEILVIEGKKKGYDRSEIVNNDLLRWKENYLAFSLMNKELNNVTVQDEEVEQYYKQTYEPDLSEQINILEILNKDLNVIAIVMDKLAGGTDFRDLAKEYSESKWTKDAGGETGFFSAAIGGEVGELSNNMQVGDVKGPIKTANGYLLFKLIERRENKSVPLRSFKEVEEFLKAKLLTSKQEKFLTNRTIDLANKYNIRVNEDILSKMEVSPLNTFTYRFIGFGGKITALPFTTPLYEWYPLWKENKKLP